MGYRERLRVPAAWWLIGLFFAVSFVTAVGFYISGLVSVIAGALTVVATKVWADSFVIARTRGAPMSWRHLMVAPLKDLLLFAILPYAAVSRSVEWRGARLRMGWGTLLRRDDGPVAVRLARWVWQGARGLVTR